MKFVTELKNGLAGLATLRDWLGDGMQTVSSDQAEGRAMICESCSMNHRGTWWELTKSLAADEIRKQIAIKNEVKVSTPLDDDIGTCKVCSCNLPLKVHVPMEHIKAHTEIETMNAFPAHCWVKKESQ